MARFEIDRDAPIPLAGAGSIELSPTGLTVVGDLILLSTPMMAVAGVAALVGTFIVAMLVQSERWPPTAVAVAIVMFVIAGLAFARRRRAGGQGHRLVVPWSDVGHVHEGSLSVGHWQIALKQPAGTLCFRILDATAVDAFHDAVDATEQLGLVAVTYVERQIATASLR